MRINTVQHKEQKGEYCQQMRYLFCCSGSANILIVSFHIFAKLASAILICSKENKPPIYRFSSRSINPRETDLYSEQQQKIKIKKEPAAFQLPGNTIEKKIINSNFLIAASQQIKERQTASQTDRGNKVSKVAG